MNLEAFILGCGGMMILNGVFPQGPAGIRKLNQAKEMRNRFILGSVYRSIFRGNLKALSVLIGILIYVTGSAL